MNSTEIKTRETICRLGASIFGRVLTGSLRQHQRAWTTVGYHTNKRFAQ
jgi:hypothetical protein